MSITHGRRPEHSEPEQEREVEGTLEWDDATLSLKRASGAIVLQLETKTVPLHLDMALLYAPDPEIEFQAPAAIVSVTLERKHRFDALAALRALAQHASAADPELQQKLGEAATSTVKRGVGCSAVSAIVLIAGSLAPWKHDGLYCVMSVFAIAFLAGVSLISSGYRQRAALRRGPPPPRP